MTAREAELLALIARHLTNAQIALSSPAATAFWKSAIAFSGDPAAGGVAAAVAASAATVGGGVPAASAAPDGGATALPASAAPARTR